MPKNKPPALVWFRQDLRLADNPALDAAVASGCPVLPVYILDDESPSDQGTGDQGTGDQGTGDRGAGDWRMGGAARWWLHQSLTGLSARLRALGAPLLLRRGRAADILPALMAETGAEAVHAGRMHEPWAREVETALAAALGPRLHLHRSSTLFDLDTIRTGSGGTYGVYTPFARACRARGGIEDPLPAPAKIRAAPLPRSDDLDAWALLPRRPDWAGGFRETWDAGEQAAQRRLDTFVGGAVGAYKTGRNLPGQPGTSMVSAHLHWGELSPRQVWHAAGTGEGAEHFRSEILWREFAAYLLWHHPDLPERPLRPAFAALPFRKAPKELHSWQRGRTGFPIVDAGMRQLWHIGWMHNRVRMVAASFLVKQLLIDWREGERWFWDTLVDADLASNAASWQWIAGCGIDSQPFFRIFNPVTQGETWDAGGDYVRQWVPELAKLPERYLHAPWTASAAILKEAGVELGRTYPKPMLDLAATRQRALDAYRSTVRTEAA